MAHWKKTEAVLFAAGKYLTIEELMNLTQLKRKETEKALEELKKHYEKIDGSLELMKDDEGYKLTVKKEYTDMVQAVVSDAEMPRPIMETLALIAYKSPVLQSEIINVRGGHAYDHVSYLEKRKFILKERSGRSYKLKTTEKFHDYFDVEEPEMQELFKNVQQPDPDKIGDLEVYKREENFDEQITERLKKPPEKENEDETKDYLKDLDERIDGVKERMEKENEDTEELTPRLENSEQTDEEQESENDKEEDSEEMLKKVNEDIDELTKN